jgi:hypothetical protein
MKETFLNAIHGRKKVRLTFFSHEDARPLIRTCAPLDYGPSRRAKEKIDRYHFWDFDSDTRVHVLSLNPTQVQKIEALDEDFEPSDFVTWDTKSSPWFVKRDWGTYS